MGSLSVNDIPPPPPGFTEDVDVDIPPPPEGFTEDVSPIQELRPTIQEAPSVQEAPTRNWFDSAQSIGGEVFKQTVPRILNPIGAVGNDLKTMFTPSERLKEDINAQASLPPATETPAPEGFTETTIDLQPDESSIAFWHRGKHRLQRDAQAGLAASGLLSPREAAENYVYHETEARKYRYDPDVVESLRQYPEEGSSSEIFSWAWNNPKAVATMFGDNIAGVVLGAAVPIAAGAAASPFGPQASAVTFAGTAGISSALMTAFGDFTAEMEDSGIDINNQEQVENFLASPEAMQRATKRAILHGVPVGVIDMITGLAGAKGVGGKIVDGIWKQAAKSAEGEAIKGTVRRAMAETGVNAAIDMTGAGVGEATGQLLSTGRIKPSQLIPEVAFELPGSIVQGGYETYLAHKQRVDPATAEMLAKAAGLGQNEPELVPVVDADAAAAEGRTFYGYAEPGKPVEVTTDYAEAERRMGSGPAKRGTLIAVRPEEVEGDVNDLTQELINSRKQGGDTGQVVDRLVASVPEEQKAAAIDAVRRVIESKSPEERNAAFEAARSLGVKVNPMAFDGGTGPVTVGRFNGDVTTRRITPRITVPLNMGQAVVDGVDDSTGISILKKSGTANSDDLNWDVDGKKLFSLLKNKIYVGVTNIRRSAKIWGKEALQNMVQVSDEALRNQLFETEDHIDSTVWKQAVKDGKVTFNPDHRLEVWSYNTVEGTTRKEVEDALEASRIKLPRGTGKFTYTDRALDDVKYRVGEFDDYQTDVDMFKNEPEGVVAYSPVPIEADIARISNQAMQLLKTWHKQFGLKSKLVFMPYSYFDTKAWEKAPTQLQKSMYGSGILGANINLAEGVAYISLRIDPKKPASAYSVLAHEFGHHLASQKFSQASTDVRAKVFAAYRRWLETVPSGGLTSRTPVARRFSAPFLDKEGHGGGASGIDMGWFYKNDPDYMLGFDEWFAEQIARWGTTNAKALGTVSRFFKQLARDIINVVKLVRRLMPEGEDYKAEPEITEWIESIRNGSILVKGGLFTEAEYMRETTEKNRPYLGEDSVPLQAESTLTRSVMMKGLNYSKQINPSTMASINAHNDRFNWFYKVALTLRQVALRFKDNPFLGPLHAYLEYIQMAKQEANKIMGDADQILLKARNLKGKGMDSKLMSFIDDLNDMVYLSPQEQQNGVRRNPSPAEFAALARQYGLSNEAIQLYMEIKGFFDQSVERFYQLDLIEAGKLSDPRAQAAALKEALTRKRQMLAAPYFPRTRFGKWAVTVRDANGKVESFELFEGKKAQLKRQRELEASKTAGQTVTISQLPDEAEPFVGIPGWLLDKLNNLPGMNPLQKQWIEQLRHHLAPQRSFAKHFLKRKNTPGYSLDWRRSFASYAFHHARNFSRLKYGELARKETELLLGKEEEGVKDPFLSQVGNMMAEHYKEFINPSRDWAVLRSVTALFHLGFSPATAMMNLSQVPLVTLPMLAQRFGDGASMTALTKAAGALSTYYKKGTLASQQGHEFRAINEAMGQGIIDESQAWQLASFSGGSKSKAGQFVRDKWLWVTSKGMFMFSATEQWNRRVTFRAAYDLAYNNPQAKWLQELDVRHSIEMGELRARQWTDREARAFLAAKEMVQQTQFAYDKLERPKFMWGRRANLFAFYMFTQNMLFTMWNNPGAAGRYMLAMAFLAGPMGLVPDDIEDILNAVARQLFGKDFNLERYARGLVVDLIGETAPGEEPKIAPDLILHGTSRYSYGIPWLMSQVGVDWLPNVDRSKSIAINRVMPMGGLTSLLRPSADVNQSIYNATQDVAGAAFGPGLAVYKALSQSDLSLFDLRNWQAAMPKAARSVTEGVRNFYNGGQIDRKGTMQVPYDRNDPQQVAELIATMLGYQPTRKSQFYDRQSAIYEVDQYWSTRRSQLLQDAFTDRFDTDDPEAWADSQQAIRAFNTAASQVDKKYMITTDTIKRSFQAKQKRRRDLEKGIPPGVSPGAAQSVGRLYPEANVIFERKVK